MKRAFKRMLISCCMIMLISLSITAVAEADELSGKMEEVISNIGGIFLQYDDYSSTGSLEGIFELPSSLQIIEDSAFEGSAITIVKLPVGVTRIGDYAFANIPTLRNVIIPSNTKDIGDDAFKWSGKVIILGASDSYARIWAEKNKIPFDLIVSFSAPDNLEQVVSLSATRVRYKKIVVIYTTVEREHVIQTGREIGELNAEKYAGCTAFHIQGRSPPM